MIVPSRGGEILDEESDKGSSMNKTEVVPEWKMPMGLEIGQSIEEFTNNGRSGRA